jgi:hypothetical protein
VIRILIMPDCAVRAITPEDIEALRANPMLAVADEDLRRNGTRPLRNRSPGVLNVQ